MMYIIGGQEVLLGEYTFCVIANDRNGQIWLGIDRPQYNGQGHELIMLLKDDDAIIDLDDISPFPQ